MLFLLACAEPGWLLHTGGSVEVILSAAEPLGEVHATVAGTGEEDASFVLDGWSACTKPYAGGWYREEWGRWEQPRPYGQVVAAVCLPGSEVDWLDEGDWLWAGFEIKGLEDTTPRMGDGPHQAIGDGLVVIPWLHATYVEDDWEMQGVSLRHDGEVELVDELEGWVHLPAIETGAVSNSDYPAQTVDLELRWAFESLYDW